MTKSTCLSANVIHYNYRFKNWNNAIILIDAERPSTKFNIPWKKPLKKPGIQGSYLNTIKATHDKIANIIINGNRFHAISLKVRNETKCQLFLLLFNVVIGVLIRVVEKVIKRIQIEKEGTKLFLFAEVWCHTKGNLTIDTKPL